MTLSLPSKSAAPKRSGPKSSAQRVRIMPAVMIAIVCLLAVKGLEMGRNFGQASASTDAAQKTSKPAGKKNDVDPALAAAAADMDAGAAPVVETGAATPANLSLNASAAPPAASPNTASPAVSAAICPGPSIAEQAGLSASEVQVLQSLSDRRKTLEGRDAELATREQLIAAAEKRVEQRLAEMKALQARVESAINGLDGKSDADTAALVRVYEKMKPKSAAAVMEALDDDVALRVASRMKEASLAVILGAMTPQKAKHLTEMLARRVDIAKKQAEAAVAGGNSAKGAADKNSAKPAPKSAPKKTAAGADPAAKIPGA